MRQIEQYFDVIHRYTPDTAVIGLTTINGVYVNTRWYQRRYIDKLILDALAVGQKANVYARITPLARPPECGRGTAQQAQGSSVLYLDYDTYRNQIAGLRALEEYTRPPTLVVNSGNGLHAYWLLDRLYADLDSIKARNKQLTIAFGGNDAGADSCYDLARVLRVPESFNVKGVDPLECSIVAYDPTRVYALSDFEPASLDDDNEGIAVWDTEPLSGDFIEQVRERDPKLAKRILSELGARKVDAPTNGNGDIDRSRNDAYIATRLLALGYSAGTVMSVLMASDWFSGSKYNERKRFDYVVMTTNAALRAYTRSPDRYFVKTAFVADKLASELHTAGNYIFTGEKLWRYVNGVYVGDGEEYIKALVVRRLGKRWSSRARDETIGYIIDQSRIPIERVNQHEGLVNCANGMLEVATGRLLAHEPRYLSTAQVPADYDPNADTRAIDKFIAEVLPKDAIPLFLEYVGSAFITNRYTPKAFITLVGASDSGKSQVLALLTNFYGGEANVSALSLQTLADNKFATAYLFGKLANIFSDLDEAEAQNVGQIKTLTGGDKISAEQKFKGFFMFMSTARVVFSANDYPAVRNPDQAYFNRIKIIPCKNNFPPGDPRTDPFIVDKLSTPANLSALLLRAYEGLQRLIANNYALSPSESVEAANSNYRFVADTVSGFLHACDIDQSFWITKQQMYQLYRIACKAQNRKEVSEDKFFKRTSDNLTRFGMVEEYKTTATGRAWCYGGRKPQLIDNVFVMPLTAQGVN
jgi:P4 family phage/plasmid primase-like protien